MFKPGWKTFSVGAVLASLTLSACGVQTSINQALTSVDGSQYLQMHLTAGVSGLGAKGAQAAKILSLVSLDVAEASTTGSPLSQSVGHIDSELKVDIGGQALVELRDIGTNLYFSVDLSALAKIPSANLPQQEIGALQLLFGNRWFEVPASLLKTYAPTTTQNLTQTSKDQAAAQQVIKAITAVIEATKYTTLPGGGYAQTGSLSSIVDAVLPTINQLTTTPVTPSKVPGTYKIAITISGATATGGSITITAPNGTSGDASVTINAAIDHASLGIDVPTGVTVITPSIIKGLMSQVSSGSLSSLG